MFGGVGLSTLKNLFKDIKIKFVHFLTPINYTEYIIKMALILHPQRVHLWLICNLILSAILLIVGAIFKSMFISFKGLFIGVLISNIGLGVFYNFRLKTFKKSDLKYVDGDIKMNPINTQFIPPPEGLANLINEEETTKSKPNKVVKSEPFMDFDDFFNDLEVTEDED